MHSLIPDDFENPLGEGRQAAGSFELPEMSGRAGRKVIEKFDCADLFYSLGIAHPGRAAAAQLPEAPAEPAQGHHRASASTWPAVDILRDRERGVPRYNQFRRLFHKPSVKTFDELCDNKEWAEEIKRAYGGDIEKGRPAGGAHGRAAARGHGLQRHRLPRLHPDGVAAPQERPLPVREYGPARYTQAGHRLDREHHDARRHQASRARK
jgi:hypothetical protein